LRGYGEEFGEIILSLKQNLFCPGCNQVNENKLLYRKAGVPIVQCLTCGLGKACPDDFDPQSYYDSSYFNGSRPDGYSDYVGARSVLQDHFLQELDLINKFGIKNGELLELGCAYGYFLEVAQQQFKVSGLEICEDAVADCQSRGLVGVRQGEISSETLAPMPIVDVVVMFDVFEHLPEPRVALEAAVSKLRLGGLLLITTGDFSSLCAKIMGRHWRLMTPPQHLWYFTPRSLRQMGESLGLELVFIDHPFKKVPLGLVVYQLCRFISMRPNLPSWMNRIGLPINLFDAMRVVFRKRIP
jgi:SAM-dependent methyltransferase